MKNIAIAVLLSVLGTLSAAAFAAAALPYGPAISLQDARKCIAAGQAEATKNGWHMVVTVLDSGGHAVAMERMDGTQFASVEVARQKAWSAIGYRRPSKDFQEFLAKGTMYVLQLEGVVAVNGGVPIAMGGKLVGAVGVSGGVGMQDTTVADACIAALK